MLKEIKMDENKKVAISENLLYTISEVAALLKVNKNYVYALINGGHLRSIKLGCRKVTRKSLLQFLEQNDGLDFDEKLSLKDAEYPHLK